MTYAVRLGGLKIRLTPFKEVLQSSCRYIFSVPQVPDQQQQDGKGDNVSKFFFHLIGTEGMHPGAIYQSPVRVLCLGRRVLARKFAQFRECATSSKSRGAPFISDQSAIKIK